MDKDFDKAKAYVFRLLGYRSRTRMEIRKKLVDKGFSSSVIMDLEEYLADYGFTDDAAFAQAWINYRCSFKPMGKQRIKLELLQKGIEPLIVEEQLVLLNDDKEFELAFTLAEKKLVRGIREAKKLSCFLERRGFNYRVIKKVLLYLGVT